jgi:hypothetical protein
MYEHEDRNRFVPQRGIVPEDIITDLKAKLQGENWTGKGKIV